MKKTDSIVDLILEIEKRPAMFLGRNSIACLKSFLDGWIYRSTILVSDATVISEFQVWIETKYKLEDTQSWDRIILFYSQDDCAALANFFNLFTQFLASYTPSADLVS